MYSYFFSFLVFLTILTILYKNVFYLFQEFIEIEAWLFLPLSYDYTINFYIFHCHVIEKADL